MISSCHQLKKTLCCCHSSHSNSRQILVIGLSSTLVCVLTLTARTSPLVSAIASSTLNRIQELRGAVGSTTITTSPGLKLLFSLHHFCLSCMRGKYSRHQRFQNRSAMYCTCFHQRLTYRSFLSKTPGGRIGLVFKSKM